MTKTGPYHSVIANSIAALSAVTTNVQLGMAAGFAQIAHFAFVPPTERTDVIDALGKLKEKVSKASLKTGDKTPVISSIDAAMKAIPQQPEKLVQSNGTGEDMSQAGAGQEGPRTTA